MINFEEILKECSYKTSRSGGAGGQHVNKVETKVSIYWDLLNSNALSEEQKVKLATRLSARISKEGLLHCSAENSRSQAGNKEMAQAKLLKIIRQALVEQKARKKTKLPVGVKEKRLEVKRIKSETKKNRIKPKW